MKKTVLITGASSGIGKATAKYFQSKGWSVVATMRSPEKETELNTLDNVWVTKYDVTDFPSASALIQETVDRFGKIDVLINNAGYGLLGPVEGASLEQIDQQFDTNVIGLINTTKEVLPHMRSNEDGCIINVSSVVGTFAIPHYTYYTSTKWAVEAFSESLWYELKPKNIRVKLIQPGPTKSDFGGRSLKKSEDNNYKGWEKVVDVAKKSPDFIDTSQSVAKGIYRAAVSRSWRLRYPPTPLAQLIVWGGKLLPGWLWRKIMMLTVK